MSICRDSGNLPLILAGALLAFAPGAPADDLSYRVTVNVDFTRVDRDRDCVPVRLQVEQDEWLLRELSWEPKSIYLDIRGAGFGPARDEDERHTWKVPDEGGQLEYCVVLNHRRSESTGWDSRLKPGWAVFRGDDLVPAGRSVARAGAQSRTRLDFELPRDWSVTTRYPTKDHRQFKVRNPNRDFDRPTGWMVAGDLGRRINRIADTHVIVSGPVGQGLEPMEILVLLGYTLQSYRDYFPDFPGRLAIIGAGEDMWRGALSGPGSLFIHADRPLVSDNGTSSLLHELGHVGLGRRGARGADWIVEGLAEYLSVHILHATGGLTDKRFSRVLRVLGEWSEDADHLDVRVSSGPVSAGAAVVFAALHRELGDAGFQILVNRLAESDEPVTFEELRHTAAEVLGEPADALDDLPLRDGQVAD